MGKKQKKRIARARRELRHVAFRNTELERQLRLERNKPAPVHMQYAIPTQVRGSPTLAYTFYVGLFEVQRMPSVAREMEIRNHAEKCLRELNEKYPPPNEWCFHTKHKPTK